MKHIYMVRSTYKGREFIYETNLTQPPREEFVRDIAAGQYDVGPIISVHVACIEEHDILFNGKLVDISLDIAKEISDFSFKERYELPPVAREFLEIRGYRWFRLPDNDSVMPDGDGLRTAA